MKLIVCLLLLLVIATPGLAAGELFDVKAAQGLFDEGLRLYFQGRYAEAIRAFERVTQINPDDARAYYFIGYSYYELRDLEKAQKSFDQAYQTDPNYNPILAPKQLLGN